jgi:ABC-type nitrate/sulfonate/bicarbonate transport system permease component
VITGLLIGGVCGVALGVIIDEVKTIHIFKKIKK